VTPKKENVEVGCVVRVLIEGTLRRVQVIGLDNKGGRGPDEFRGFILGQDEKPRHWYSAVWCVVCSGYDSGDEFINFPLSNCREVEVERHREETFSFADFRAALGLA